MVLLCVHLQTIHHLWSHAAIYMSPVKYLAYLVQAYSDSEKTVPTQYLLRQKTYFIDQMTNIERCY